jgi:hypothetical protein
MAGAGCWSCVFAGVPWRLLALPIAKTSVAADAPARAANVATCSQVAANEISQSAVTRTTAEEAPTAARIRSSDKTNFIATPNAEADHHATSAAKWEKNEDLGRTITQPSDQFAKVHITSGATVTDTCSR